ncbi:unnamed protein product [Vitrella brassicaformis CCMP3155]|uniref:Uncharacterized protein n=1 Tax=Vitrella brassicaformis (strain CCMP3155) TaxID=1169540 RepID=A0A0G4EG67_VITBC|nr:unnamed protein product [Vitrella brassicaformis CCMP3155]|mmetsp:Transcript_50125/g.125687  ORF Transcript_50125/g.125687 Transcript_50125/m.125687 type:complete len:119 (+) Transcript_50125:1343-1699(+)|eukprot:CEL94443.1 unnamed protein product [Vitrella brassicaformis CCMP3155]
MAGKELAKEFAHIFRWQRAFQKHRAAPPTAEPLSRYTNFTLQHAWEKYDCQTHLLLREALIPTVAQNPEVLDADLEFLHTKTLSLTQPASGPYGSLAGKALPEGGKAIGEGDKKIEAK